MINILYYYGKYRKRFNFYYSISEISWRKPCLKYIKKHVNWLKSIKEIAFRRYWEDLSEQRY
jgi:hypothetical protein